MKADTSIQSLSDLLEASVRDHGKRTLFLTKSGGEWHKLSYREFAAGVEDFCSGLAELGVEDGDRIGIISDNCVEWATIAFSAYGRGAALVPMYEVQREEEWVFIVRDSGLKVLFVANLELLQRVSDLTRSILTLKHIVCLSGEAPLTYASVLERGRKAPVPRVHPASEQLAALLYTSGTTGEPKGVRLSHGNIVSNLTALRPTIEAAVDKPEEQTSLAFLPWAHAFGYTAELHQTIAVGASMAIAEGVDKLVDNLQEVRPTILVAVPKVFLRIHAGVHQLISRKPRPVQHLFRHGLELSRKRASTRLTFSESLVLWLCDTLVFSKVRARFGGRLKFSISGAAALPREVAEFIDALGIAVYEGYGLTETSPVAAANTPGHRKIGSVGKPVPGVRIEIDTSKGHDSQGGEIIIYGPNVMKGYHERAEENRRVFTSDGGLRTGDLGYLDVDGYLFITGRIKEQYKLTNAKYVVPGPLEDELKLSPFIENVMIYGDNRPHNVALIVPDPTILLGWAEREGMGELGLEELLGEPRVKALFQAEIERLSGNFRPFERVKDFALLPEDFTQENGMATPSLKLKRREIVRHYAALLSGLYASGEALVAASPEGALAL